MRRLFIHAGFPKTGSSTIQYAIGRSLPALNEVDYFLLGSQLNAGRDGVHPGLPLWFFENARNTGTSLAGTIEREMSKLPENATILITSENLGQPGMAELFAGIDRAIRTEVVFYIRPQTEWIPSAWKQWSSKTGLSLSDFVRHCIKMNRPSCLSSVEAWERVLPDAQVTVRPFFRDTMTNGNPADDFFSLVGFDGYDRALSTATINPSLDHSLVHVMMKNSGIIYKGIHDNEIETKLSLLLPDEYKATNARMLSEAAARSVERHFREENLQILRRYCGLPNPDAFYESHFVSKSSTGQSYMDMDESEILVRCFRVLLSAMGTARASAALGVMISDLVKD